jgi:DNA-binding MarR family transcriptional regulator
VTGTSVQAAEQVGLPAARLDQCEKRMAERRRVGRHLGFSTFANPAWDMLLDLYRAALRGHDISISSLTLASNVPATTARRCIEAMEADKLVSYRPDPTDRRRTYVAITYLGFEAMNQVFDETTSCAENVQLLRDVAKRL